MCKFIGKFLCKLSKSEILTLYSIVRVAMKTTKTSNFTCQSKSFITILSLCQVSACELQRFSCRELANEIYSQTAKTVFSHLKQKTSVACPLENLQWLSVTCFSTACTRQQTEESVDVSMSF